ncbi:MAG: enolase C-terminal domain-like protein [Trueperaceae bacterium]|nr:enolase C-terminal domain-like protein [Trueperaceae bacterium]
MKITSIEAVPIRVAVPHAPYPSDGAGTKFHWGRRGRATSLRPRPVLEYVLVKIETDEGLVGWGESQADVGFFGHTVEDVQAAVTDYLGPYLIGGDPRDRDHLLSVVDYRGHSTAKAGLDMALLDLAGRALGAPVADLLGGRHPERARVSLEIAGGPPDAMAAECVRFVELGVRELKAKIGGHPDQDADRLRAIREAVGPDVRLRADANQGYDVKEAIRFCRLVERADVGLGLLEQPVAAHDLRGMALVRASVETPICADEACYSPVDALRIVEHGAADVLNVKIGKAGGLTAAKKVAAIAEAAGLRCVIGTAFGTGLEVAAKLHLFASTPSIVEAVEFTELGLHDLLLAEPDAAAFALPLRDEALDVPLGPGLGVALDPARVWAARLAVPQPT